MSLFGKSPDESNSLVGTKPRNSLFDDDEVGPNHISKSSSLAGTNVSDASPWGSSLPKASGINENIEVLLPESAIPESYNEIFNGISNDGRSYYGNINRAGVSKILFLAKLSSGDEQQVLNTIYQGASPSELSRERFNVLLALIGLAQEYSDITLEKVTERIQNLPVPHIPGLLRPSSRLHEFGESVVVPPSKPNSLPEKKSHVDLHDSDSWASTAENQNRYDTPSESKVIDNEINNGYHGSSKQISSLIQGSIHRSDDKSIQQPLEPAVHHNEAWISGNPSAASESINGQKNGADRYGADSGRQSSAKGDSSISFGRQHESGLKTKETVKITVLPEKEGIFMFQHRNYQVSSSYRASKVVRRYSDFVWLLDCLQKRFAFRQLPLLPPKRVGLNGNHLAVDRLFIEKRRRGLVRFTNTLLRHPVLREDHLVKMFLTVPTELSLWRKQASYSIQDEFNGKLLPPGLEDSLPLSLDEVFEKARIGISKSADICINLCILMDRLAKRHEGLAADQLRISLSLELLCDVTLDVYSTNSKDVHLVNKSLQNSSTHLNNSQSLLVDEAKAWDEGVIEDLKTLRDSLVSMRQLFERRDQLGKDNIPSLERRIKKNNDKLEEIRSKPEGIVKPEEVRKLNEAILKDQESIVSQHARGVFIRECVRDELQYFQQTQYQISRWTQDWAQERVKYSELQADNWKKLAEELEQMLPA